MTHVIDPNEGTAVKGLSQLFILDDNVLLEVLEVRLDQRSQVWETIRRQFGKVFQQSLRQPVEEVFYLHRLFQDLIQASGLSFQTLRHDVDVNADPNRQVDIFALVLGSGKHTTDLLALEKDVVHPLHRGHVGTALLLCDVLNHLEHADRRKLSTELCAAHVALDEVAYVEVSWRRGPRVRSLALPASLSIRDKRVAMFVSDVAVGPLGADVHG